MKLQQEFINRIKQTVYTEEITPKYDPDKWYDKIVNCYAYAMRMCIDLCGYMIMPGIFSRGEKNDYKPTKECTLKYFREDCEALGLQVTPTNMQEEITANGYKIAIYVKEGKDFHFARQDCTGSWSEKNGWQHEIEPLDSNEVAKNKYGYEFVGIYRVSQKAG